MDRSNILEITKSLNSRFHANVTTFYPDNEKNKIQKLFVKISEQIINWDNFKETIGIYIIEDKVSKEVSGSNIKENLKQIYESNMENGSNVIFCDIEGNVVQTGIPKNVKFESYENLNTYLEMRGDSLDLDLNCELIFDNYSLTARSYKHNIAFFSTQNILSASSKTKSSTKNHIGNYEWLIQDHAKNHLVKGKSIFDIWVPSKKWTMYNKLEKNFQNSLLIYFEDNLIAECIVDKENFVNNSSDKVDITVTSYDSKKYHFEIKYMGKLNSGDIYKEDKALDGYVQAKIYLEKDDNCIKGVPVVYDGRENKTLISIPYELKAEGDRVGTDDILYVELEFESASNRAKKNVKKSKRT